MWTMTPHGRSALLSCLGRGVLLASAVQFSFYYFGIRLNTTASLPIGLYVESADVNTQLVEFCPSGPEASVALSRGYRAYGVCADGGEPLLKPAVAKGGDVVTVSGSGIAVNGKLIPNTHALITDSSGRALTPYPTGVYAVADGVIWVVSTFSQKSFDSRYFGPVNASLIRAHLKPLVVISD